MSASRFSFKNLFQLFGKAQGVSLSHPSDLVNWNDSGWQVTADTAMRITAVYSCVRIKCDSVASVPLNVYRRIGKGKEEAIDHPLWKLLHDEPCPGMTSFLWRETLQQHMELRGNIYCFKVFSRRRIVALIPIHPDRVQVKKQSDGTKKFEIYTIGRGFKTYTSEEIWHMVGQSDDGCVGKSPIDILADAFSIARDAQRYASKSLKNDGATGLTLSHPGKLKPETKEALKKSWEEQSAGPDNAGRPLLLEEGLKADRINLTMAQMQFIETRKMQRSEIASIFRVPPHMIGDLERATFSNIEQQGIEFVSYTVRPVTRRWEASLLNDIVSWYNEPDLFVKFDTSELLRGDTKSRYEGYSSAILAGWLTRNEAREDEDYNPLPGLDKPFEPSNTGGAGDKPPNKKPDPEADPSKDPQK